MASFPKSDRGASDFVEGMMEYRPSRERQEELRDHERRQDQEAIQEMEDFWEGLLQEISNIITKKRDTFDKMKVFRFKHLEYHIRQDNGLDFLSEKDFTEKNFEILKKWCDGKMGKIISIFNRSDDDTGKLEFILGNEYLPRVSIDYTERKNKFTAMSQIINTPKTLPSKRNYMKIADICRLLNFFREIDWDEINNNPNFFYNMKEMNGYGPEDKALDKIDNPNWFGRGKDFLNSSEGEAKKESSSAAPKKESSSAAPKKESSKKVESRGICPFCNKDVFTTESRIKDAGIYYHEKCNKFKNEGWGSRQSKSNPGKTMYWHKEHRPKPMWELPEESSTTTAPELSQFEKDMAERAALRKSRKSSAKSSTKPYTKPSVKPSTKPVFKIDTKKLEALKKNKKRGGRRTKRKSRKKLRKLSKRKRKRTRKRRKKHRKTTRKKY